MASNRSFELSARIDSTNLSGIRETLENFLGEKAIIEEVRDEKGGFVVTATLRGESAKELNRSLLSSLRKVEKRTTLRAEWSAAGTTERYFDYVLKKTVKSKKN